MQQTVGTLRSSKVSLSPGKMTLIERQSVSIPQNKRLSTAKSAGKIGGRTTHTYGSSSKKQMNQMEMESLIANIKNKYTEQNIQKMSDDELT